MKPIIVSETYPYKLDLAWEIISDLKRSDWVPGVENITLDGDVRSFTMEGMGEIKEKILLCDEQKKNSSIFCYSDFNPNKASSCYY